MVVNIDDLNYGATAKNKNDAIFSINPKTPEPQSFG